MKAKTLKGILGLALVALVLVTSMGFASAVYAEDAEDSAKAKGAGTLTAQGDGIALLGGRGTVEVSGNGILWIKDLASDAVIKVSGQGEKEEFPDGWIQYAGFHGNASVEGSRIRVIVAGVDIDLFAEGRGRVLLWGHGTYQINGQSGQWDAERLGTRVGIAPTDTSLTQ
ncbi:MAG: hypothetical protein ISS52_02420 [Dehalococcoidia bacterium]|nr:hypothetical protein [Dehalococcoidia bacterium]